MQKLRQPLSDASELSKALGPFVEEEELRGEGRASPWKLAAVTQRDTGLHVPLISFLP